MPQPVACVVPARRASSRFPGKLLHPLEGEPLIVHTLRRARAAECFSQILCLADSEDILAAARAAGFDGFLTGEAMNGTDRIARHLDAVSTDLIVNLQGDEPAFPPEGLRQLWSALRNRPDRVHLLVHADEPSASDLADPNRVKAGMDADGLLLDFYRGEPGYAMDSSRLQMGAYGYSKDFLRRYAATPPSPRELAESHELLRSLDLAPIQAHRCGHPSQAVDVPRDLEAAAALLRRGFQAGAEAAPPALQELPLGEERMTIIDPNTGSRGERVQA